MRLVIELSVKSHTVSYWTVCEQSYG